ncbi:MAG: hypothetical protein J5673_04110 [Candidatus Methanomethylophilaceae archaeon]|nr:hypothetical protein [Candidatus Methanomethylophilaceae archaeon]
MQRVCASVNSIEEIQNTMGADLMEVSIETFRQMTEMPEMPMIVRVSTMEEVAEMLTKKWNGYLDVGELPIPETSVPVITSIRDGLRTMSSQEIVDRMNGSQCEIAVGFFTVNRPEDLVSIYDASPLIQKKHVLVGLGEMGSITRYRSRLLGNEFDFAHAGTPAYIGQRNVEELKKADPDALIVGLVGHPLSQSASKRMHTQAFKDAGIDGHYLNFDTVSLDGLDDVIRDYNIKGLNVTIPYKDDILAYVDVLDQSAKNTGAASMILNMGDKLVGSNIDVDGAKFALERAGVEIEAGMKILIIGSGGVAMACCYLFTSKGAEVTIIGRNQKTVKDLCRKFGCETSDRADPSEFEMIVNCTPIGMYEEEKYPIDITKLRAGQIVFDVVYTKETQLEAVGREHECTIVPGLDMLIGQGMRSFEVWTGQKATYESMRYSLVGDSGRMNLS